MTLRGDRGKFLKALLFIVGVVPLKAEQPYLHLDAEGDRDGESL